MAPSRRTRRAALGSVLSCLLLAGAAGTATAAVPDPIPVRPDTPFHGLVNGATVNAVIKVGCFGPVLPGQTGHPLAGQVVEADSTPPPTSSTSGYTGSAGTSLIVTVLGSPSSRINVIGTLTSFYAPLPIPTTLTLPCGGTVDIGFTPLPTSPTARPSVVQVSLVGEP